MSYVTWFRLTWWRSFTDQIVVDERDFHLITRVKGDHDIVWFKVIIHIAGLMDDPEAVYQLSCHVKNEINLFLSIYLFY